ncbi:probable AP-4 complex accessory subunit Tepsin at N-terminal half [Coccomyxa sp. Obi]|nr:probable AP-4 complex accessory subunit Tepsin at N-terminal half [Coccomyxa sp. Obi]
MFANIQNRLKIDEATSSNDDVTPVYVLEELWQLVQSLPPDGNAFLVECAKRRLKSKSPIVKQKTLRMIKHICGKGSSDFKRGFQKQAAPVRELTHYKGEPDPFKGDVLNQRVRDSAKEALDAIFAATALNPPTTPAPLQSRIQGFGGGSSDSISSTSSRGPGGGLGGSSATGSSRMTGFGNPKLEGSTGGSTGGVTSPKSLLGSIGGKAGFGSTTRHAPFMIDEVRNNGSDDERPSGYQPRPLTIGMSSVNSSSSAPQLAASNDGDEEVRLVDGICAVGGVRAQPSREDLRLFVENIASLNGTRVAELLRAKMEDASWQTVLRALSAVEAVVQQGSTAACGEVAVHFQADSEPVRRAAASAQASVRQRAAALLKLLGTDDAASAPRAAQPSPVGDLMGGMDETAAPQPSTQDLLGDLMDPAPAAQPSGTQGGIFDGLAVGPKSPAQAQPPQSDSVFVAAPASTASIAGAADMFGGLSLSGPGQSSASGAGQMSADPFGGLSAPHPGPTSAGVKTAANGNIFGGLAVGGLQSNGAPAAAGSGKAGSLALDADLFGGELSQPSTTHSVGVPVQGNGSVTDIFGSNSSPTMITLASPVKPTQATQQFGYAQAPQAFQHNPQGLGGLPQMYQQQMQFPGMYTGPQQMQQAQQLQMQHYQMQQMQLQQMQMQQMGMGGFGAPAHQTRQQQSFSGLSNGAALGSDVSSGNRTTAAPKSDHLGAKKDAAFDFVGDHISNLRTSK